MKQRSQSAHALYIHIPFCKSKCHYCDFVVRVLHEGSQIDRYLEYLLPELQALSVHSAPLKTIYCGGGTPALLDAQQARYLTNFLHQHYDLKELEEWTLEANPDALSTPETHEALKRWQQAGVNRISLGVQSFDNQLLKDCGRSHQAEDIKTAVRDLRRLGFNNISLDLIYALPKQSMTSWQNTLQQALNLEPEHISLYALEVHPDTVFGHRNLSLPDDDLAVDMYDLACLTLAEAGYLHYEIANWSKTGYASQHNQVYWQSKAFLAAGVGAHGYLHKCRYANPSRLRAYYQRVAQQDWSWQNTPEQSLKAEIEEYVFLALRLLEKGLDLSEFKHTFDVSLESLYSERLAFLLKKNLLFIDNNCLKLHPGSVAVSNSIFAEFLDPCLPENNVFI